MHLRLRSPLLRDLSSARRLLLCCFCTGVAFAPREDGSAVTIAVRTGQNRAAVPSSAPLFPCAALRAVDRVTCTALIRCALCVPCATVQVAHTIRYTRLHTTLTRAQHRTRRALRSHDAEPPPSARAVAERAAVHHPHRDMQHRDARSNHTRTGGV